MHASPTAAGSSPQSCPDTALAPRNSADQPSCKSTQAAGVSRMTPFSNNPIAPRCVRLLRYHKCNQRQPHPDEHDFLIADLPRRRRHHQLAERVIRLPDCCTDIAPSGLPHRRSRGTLRFPDYKLIADRRASPIVSNGSRAPSFSRNPLLLGADDIQQQLLVGSSRQVLLQVLLVRGII